MILLKHLRTLLKIPITLITLSLLLACFVVQCKNSTKESISVYINNQDTDNSYAQFMALSDIHLDLSVSGTPYGCDTGTKLWSAAKKQFTNLLETKKPQFILYLGDLPVHTRNCSIFSKNQQEINTNIATVLADMRIIATNANIPLLYLPGNNDGIMGNYTSFSAINPKAGTYNNAFDLDSVGANQWPIISSKKPSFFHQKANDILGYYSAYPLGISNDTSKINLKLIMLNSVIYSPLYKSFDGIDQLKAAKSQFDFLSIELQDAANKGDAVIIAMHIPAGSNGGYDGSFFWEQDMLIDGSNFDAVFAKIITKYNKNIRAILTSHTHMEEIKRVFSKDSTLVGLCVSVPSISPNHKNNPSMKFFSYDTENYQLTNFTTWYAEDIPFTFSDTLGYTFKDIYKGCPNATSLLECIGNISDAPTKAGRDSIISLMEKYFDVRKTIKRKYPHHIGLDIIEPSE